MMRVVAFGGPRGPASSCSPAALASLAIGLFPYGAFLLLSARATTRSVTAGRPRSSRSSVRWSGVAVMAVGASLTDGAARVAALGIGHTAAFCVGALVLGFDVHRRRRDDASGTMRWSARWGSRSRRAARRGSSPTSWTRTIGSASLVTLVVGGAVRARVSSSPARDSRGCP